MAKSWAHDVYYKEDGSVTVGVMDAWWNYDD
jgi:hypothetical protein